MMKQILSYCENVFNYWIYLMNISRLKFLYWINDFNSQVSSWFCKTNDPLIYCYPVLNVVVSEKYFKGLPLKFYFWHLVISARTGNKILKVLLTGIENQKFQCKRNDLSKSVWPYRVIFSLQSIPLVVENQLETWGLNFFETWLLFFLSLSNASIYTSHWTCHLTSCQDFTKNQSQLMFLIFKFIPSSFNWIQTLVQQLQNSFFSVSNIRLDRIL